jgi:large subunit ribosomal protein L9
MANMNVILLEGVQGVGKVGDTVTVKAGFARNFLLPRAKALLANAANLAEVQSRKADLEAKNSAAKSAAEKQSAKFTDLVLSLSRLASETGQLYGSVKARDLAESLNEKNLDIEAGQILIGEPIRSIGEHTVRVVLHPEVIVPLSVSIERQSAN